MMLHEIIWLIEEIEESRLNRETKDQAIRSFEQDYLRGINGYTD